MGRLRTSILILLIGILSFFVYSTMRERQKYTESVTLLREKKIVLEKENKELSEKIEYLKKPENLLKEARAQFNFVYPGEKVIILIPKKASTSATSTQ